MTMLAFIVIPSLEFVARQASVRACWSIPERKQRAMVAQIKQAELGLLLAMRIMRSIDIGSEISTYISRV